MPSRCVHCGELRDYVNEVGICIHCKDTLWFEMQDLAKKANVEMKFTIDNILSVYPLKLSSDS